MAEENNIDDILEDIPDGSEAEPQVEAPVEEPAEEPVVEPEEVEEAESAVAKLFDVDHSGKTVPVDKHVKLRERAQKAEAERDALKEKMFQQADVDVNVLADLGSLVEDGDDEYVEKGKLKQVVEKLPDVIAHVAQEKIDKVIQQTASQNIQNKAINDEKAFRKEHKDYDEVTRYAKSRHLITDAELQDIFAGDDIAEAYYNKAKEKIDQERQILGIAKTDNTQQSTEAPATPVDDSPLDDDAGFEAFMAGGIGS